MLNVSKSVIWEVFSLNSLGQGCQTLPVPWAKCVVQDWCTGWISPTDHLSLPASLAPSHPAPTLASLGSMLHVEQVSEQLEQVPHYMQGLLGWAAPHTVLVLAASRVPRRWTVVQSGACTTQGAHRCCVQCRSWTGLSRHYVQHSPTAAETSSGQFEITVPHPWLDCTSYSALSSPSGIFIVLIHPCGAVLE